ncbi:hypothetical protein F0331_06380 [Klebsiella variicola]|nr:hypothetical protein F0331_06380 [Klebsiella variicola]
MAGLFYCPKPAHSHAQIYSEPFRMTLEEPAGCRSLLRAVFLCEQGSSLKGKSDAISDNSFTGCGNE